MSWQIHDKLAFSAQVLGLSKYKLSLFPKAKFKLIFVQPHKRKVGQFSTLSLKVAQGKSLNAGSLSWRLHITKIYKYQIFWYICSNTLSCDEELGFKWCLLGLSIMLWPLLATSTICHENALTGCSAKGWTSVHSYLQSHYLRSIIRLNNPQQQNPNKFT